MQHGHEVVKGIDKVELTGMKLTTFDVFLV